MTTTTTYEQWCHDVRKQIDATIQNVKQVKEQEFDEPEAKLVGAREIALAYTKLQEAKMWIGKVLEELGSPFPKELADKAE